jgi:spore coat polysaccharide biosynthesis protein SpsF (cytidylyltransferase family)
VTGLNHDPKFACFITVRTASSRLPKKALLRLNSPRRKSRRAKRPAPRWAKCLIPRVARAVSPASPELERLSPWAVKGKTALEHPIERVKCVQRPVQIVVRTTTLDQDDLIRDIAETNAGARYRGSSADKPVRCPGAARYFGIDHSVIEDRESTEKEQQPC